MSEIKKMKDSTFGQMNCLRASMLGLCNIAPTEKLFFPHINEILTPAITSIYIIDCLRTVCNFERDSEYNKQIERDLMEVFEQYELWRAEK